MKVALIDLDNYNKTAKFPNLAIMKISTYHKEKGDTVEWYQILNSGYDLVYVSKVFSWIKEFPYAINSKKIIYGGIGYDLENKLLEEQEHSFPDYSLYQVTKNKAYGFLSRGCPRECKFCNVSQHQGKKSKKVSNLPEFWNGQEEIILLDPNILACPDYKELLQQLAKSKAYVDFSQGLDIRLMTEEKIKLLNNIKIKMIHFAWDSFEMKTYKMLKQYRNSFNLKDRQLIVYVLVNFNTTLEEDLKRIYMLRAIGYTPYVMRYKDSTAKSKLLEIGSIYNKLARWVNRRQFFNKFKKFEDYLVKSY